MRQNIIIGLLIGIAIGIVSLIGTTIYGISRLEEISPGYYQITIIGPKDVRKVIEGDIPYIISQLEYAKSIHEYYLTIPPTPETGSHAWHRRWIRIYEETIRILEQRK